MSQWADRKRRLSPEASAEPGPWRTSRVPYLREVMDACGDPRVATVCCVLASQVGKTEAVNNVVGYHVDLDPAPILVIQPTLDMARTWSTDRLAPMLRDTPALRGLVRDAKSRDAGNTVLHKIFPGGHVTVAGANSPASLASRPIRVLLLDEVDRYPPSAGTEGDPVKLAERRTTSFWNARKILISSPGTKGASRIEIAWKRSDQRRYYAPCPDCDHRQVLTWVQVKWDKDAEGTHLPKSARYECEACGSRWDDLARQRAVARGEWRATKPFRGVAGFHLNALYSPWEQNNLERLVELWLEAQGNPELLKVFMNTVLAEWWTVKASSVPADDLAKRREEYPARGPTVLVPAPVVVLTAGVDLQDDRAEVTVDGWGRGEECWRVEHEVFDGDPTGSALWLDLWEHLCRPRQMARGGEDHVRATCVDSGHLAQVVYEFCGPRHRVMTPDGRRAYTFAVKGRAGAGPLWPADATRTKRGGALVWLIHVDAAKEVLYGRLQKVVRPGPGYIHFPMSLGERYFRQLTAERVKTETDKRNFPIRTWELKSAGRRNEALDCAVYSYAALAGLKAMGLDLDREAEKLGVPIAAPPLEEDSDHEVAVVPPPPPTRRRRRAARRSSYLG